jgi:hypothetical protein
VASGHTVGVGKGGIRILIPIPALQSFKDDVDLKQDLRCDTIDTREEYEMKVGKGTGAGYKGWLGS